MIFSDLNRQPKDENNRSPQDPMFNIAQDKKDSMRTVPVRNTDLSVLTDRSERHCDLGAHLLPTRRRSLAGAIAFRQVWRPTSPL
jgi:hypothetical protein